MEKVEHEKRVASKPRPVKDLSIGRLIDHRARRFRSTGGRGGKFLESFSTQHSGWIVNVFTVPADGRAHVADCWK
jgi:hypothetical protein